MKKLLSMIMCVALVVGLFVGCGGASSSSSSDDSAVTDSSSSDTDDSTEDSTDDEEDVEVTTVGPDSGTHFEMWSFVALHNDFYGSMVEKWNEENPDKQIQVTFTTYPYDSMHNKLMLALQSGTGAPDLCDIEIGQFPNFLEGEVQFYPMNDAVEPYIDNVVQSRLDTYSKDGTYYGIPTHVGATVMYYNTEILDQYGIDYTQITTWDDYTAAAEELKEASNGEVQMTSVDTGGTDWLWLAMAEYGEDWTGGEDGEANVELDSVKKMLNMQKDWVDNDLAGISPGGHLDNDEGFQYILDGSIASFPKALWYMSRFLSYMPEMSGQWAIAPCPVFEEGQNRSVGIGGTGTVVTNQSEDPELAAEFLAYAKLSPEGEEQIWDQLGFDVVNTTLWTDTDITEDSSNQYLQYFETNPFDVLNEIKDEIGMISTTSISPTINTQIDNITLNDIFENDVDVDEALEEAQDAVELEE